MLRRLAIVAVAACSTQGAPPPAPKPAPVRPPADAPPGITKIHGYDPASGLHLDEGGERHAPEPPVRTRAARPIDITLRSTPSGAQVAVDGTVIGTTPTYWPGEADGREHEFDFVLAGHAAARYRFVPVTSGVVHARLEPIVEDQGSNTAGSADTTAPAAATPPVPVPVPVPGPVPGSAAGSSGSAGSGSGSPAPDDHGAGPQP